MNRAKAQPAVDAYFFGSLTMNLTFVGAPAERGVVKTSLSVRPAAVLLGSSSKHLALSSEVTCLVSQPGIDCPIGKWRVRLRQALMATSLPSLTGKPLRAF